MARIRLASLFALLSLGALACGPNDGGGGADGAVTDDPCSGDATRCLGQSYQVCGSGGTFVEEELCAGTQVCDPEIGCAECRPSDQRVCSGDEVHTCNADGTVGDLLDTCDPGTCVSGGCSSNCNADGSDLIYVIDETYRLLSFDPRKLGTMEDPFTLIGSVSCPAGASWPGWGVDGPATPFSMSVDRDAVAWVLFTSGEIFHVSTADASCQATSYVPGQLGLELFGMGFVTDAPGSDEETLFIAGGSSTQSTPGTLAAVDKMSLQASSIGNLPTAGFEFGPELTGTGNAELFGYYPGMVQTLIANIDKTTAQNGQSWPMTPLGGSVRAWAFAHWGGKFYVFITTVDVTMQTTSRVLLLDPDAPMGSQETVAIANIPYVIVGAGVSTCAPTVIE